jgi:hypothetical protein
VVEEGEGWRTLTSFFFFKPGVHLSIELGRFFRFAANANTGDIS